MAQYSILINVNQFKCETIYLLVTWSWTAILQFQASTREFSWLEDQVDNGLSPCGESSLCQDQNIGHLSLPLRTAGPRRLRKLVFEVAESMRSMWHTWAYFLTFIKAVRQALPQAALSSPWPFESGVYPCPGLPFSLPQPSSKCWLMDLQHKQESSAGTYIYYTNADVHMQLLSVYIQYVHIYRHVNTLQLYSWPLPTPKRFSISSLEAIWQSRTYYGH